MVDNVSGIAKNERSKFIDIAMILLEIFMQIMQK